MMRQTSNIAEKVALRRIKHLDTPEGIYVNLTKSQNLKHIIGGGEGIAFSLQYDSNVGRRKI
jgi:hypothetical protein